MKTTKIIYWSFTGLFSIFMLGSSYADLVRIPEAKTIMTHLGFPLYIMWFIGLAKLLGLVAILVPKFPKITEWAYAGFVFNLTGGWFSHIAVGDPINAYMRPLFILILLVGSYIFYHRRLKALA
ncbi:MAG: DoxX family protein [Chitinophagaceae bacterium]